MSPWNVLRSRAGIRRSAEKKRVEIKPDRSLPFRVFCSFSLEEESSRIQGAQVTIFREAIGLLGALC